jgi:rhomboid protease GluP
MFALTGDAIKQARVTLILIGINVISYIFLNVILYNSPDYLFAMAQYNQAVWDGEVWRLITSIFVHWDISHITFNMIGLLIYGATLEHFFTKKLFLITYLTSGLLGSVFSLLLGTPFSIGAGASGAIFGIMGACFVILAKENPNYICYSLMYLGLSVYNSFQPGIGTWAHIFGLVGGLLFGYLYVRKQNDIKKAYYSRRPTRTF